MTKRTRLLALLLAVSFALPQAAYGAEYPGQDTAAEASADAGTDSASEGGTAEGGLQDEDAPASAGDTAGAYEGTDPETAEAVPEEAAAESTVEDAYAGMQGWNDSRTMYYYSDGSFAAGPSMIDGRYLFFDEEGNYVQKGWPRYGADQYYVADGYIHTGWQTINGFMYYMGEDGVISKGYRTIEDRIYYFWPDTRDGHYSGTMLIKPWSYIDPDTQVYMKDGIIATGWNTINGFTYYMKEDTGAITKGWAEINGKKYYFWPKTQGKHYSGTMATGWNTINGFYYYMGNDGEMKPGWQEIDGRKYYFWPETKDGRYSRTAAKGWQTIDGKKYYFWEKSSGSNKVCQLATGWNTINGYRYYMGGDGEIRTGWQTIDGNEYYFWPAKDAIHYRGTAAAGFCIVDGKTYFFDKNGVKSSNLPEMTITAIDYTDEEDYGDMVLLYSKGKYLLMDTGMPDTDDKRLIKWLKAHNVRNLDIYVSHFHNDHLGNVEYILKDNYFNIGTLYMPDHSTTMTGYQMKYWNFEKHERLYKGIMAAAKNDGCRIAVLKKGSTFRVGDVSAKVIWKKESLSGYSNFSDFDTCVSAINDASLCTMFTCGDVKYLTCGDIQIREEKKILAAGADVDADILKLSHHGYGTSSCSEWLKAVSPSYMISTCPDDNGRAPENSNYGGREASKRAVGYGNLFGTCYHGDIVFTVKYGRISVKCGKHSKTVSQNVRDPYTGETRSVSITLPGGVSRTYVRAKSLPFPYVKN